MKKPINITSSGYITQVQQASTPVTPASGEMAIYPKNDGNYYKLNDAGVETILSGPPTNTQFASRANTVGPVTTDGASVFDILSITCGAGTWDISGVAGWTRGPGSFNITGLVSGVSLVSATLPAGWLVSNWHQTVAAVDEVAQPIATKRYTFASTTTVYLVSQLLLNASSATIYGFGFIEARFVG